MKYISVSYSILHRTSKLVGMDLMRGLVSQVQVNQVNNVVNVLDRLYMPQTGRSEGGVSSF